MRWKLLLISTLAATLAGVGACLAVVYFLVGMSEGRPVNTPVVLATIILPLAAIAYASIFVYRHTARRRTLQAMLTTLLSIALTLGALFAASALFARPTEIQPIPPPVNNNAV